MQRRKFIALLASFWPFSVLAADITRVAVFDAEFRPIRTIASGPELAAFNELWAARIKENPLSAMRPDYKIDVLSNGRSERWLYDPAGFVQVLSVKSGSTYRLPSPAAFNGLLGIGRQ